MAANTTPAGKPKAKKPRYKPTKPVNQNPTAIREAREARGLTQADLAAQVGRSHTYISEIEKGDRDARRELLQSIADALGVDYDLLERPRERAQCGRCDYRYEVRPDGRTPLHLRGDGPSFCDSQLAVSEAA
jgi:ribosome-binding protein aMBF1 (putative translation factor)